MGSRAISMKNVRAFKVVTSCPLWATVETYTYCTEMLKVSTENNSQNGFSVYVMCKISVLILYVQILSARYVQNLSILYVQNISILYVQNLSIL
jgi:hypothetical protein